MRVGVILAALAALGLTACVSVFPKTKPAQLYRFSGETAAAASAPGPKIAVLRQQAIFPRAAAGDRILTVTGEETAYIAEARWLSPAPVLFEEALTRAFDANDGRARLAGRAEGLKADHVLRLEVRAFETIYDQGAEAAPKVVVRVRGALLPRGGGAVADDHMFEASVRAGDNRVGPIVEAYDKAVGQVLGELVGWVNSAVSAPKAG